MITAVDTQVLLDVLLGDPVFADPSVNALDRARQEGSLAICEAVIAELATRFPVEQTLKEFLEGMSLGVLSSATRTWWEAGQAWRGSTSWRRGTEKVQCPACENTFVCRCPECRRPVVWRQHVLVDFVIGAHASAHADRLMTRDQGYYRRWFPKLTLVDPADPGSWMRRDAADDGPALS